MREIKFRAWDLNSKKMLSVKRPCVGVSKDGSLCFDEGLREGVILDWLIHGDDCILMQYTGLKDKNGKEIYEGDIVENIHVRNLSTVIELKGSFEVLWHDGGFMVMGGNPHGMRRDCFCHYPHNWEIIGNIHQNPNLLKE